MATMLLLLLLLLHNHPILLAQLELTHSVMATFQQQKEEEEEQQQQQGSMFFLSFILHSTNVIVLQYYSPHFYACGLYKVTINSLHGIHKPSTPFRTKEGAM